ncbi:MAG: hypothetical protein K0S76_2033 [Herbinix sp.]|jgi:purine-binding chemotaxis protein CheW|nr:hypothetical protein [Herbinix sp.]
MQNMQQAVFCIGKEEYGLDIMEVNIIEKLIPFEQVANAPKNVKGIMNLRGDFIPVYSLRSKFGLADLEPDEETRLIITKSGELLIAYEVDKMQEIAQLNPGQIMEVPSVFQTKDTAYVKAVTNIDGRLILLLNSNGILTEEEHNSLKAILEKKRENKK